MSSKDFISLKGIRGFGHHGVFPEETANGQEFIVDVEIHLELRKAGETDELDKTIDYGKVSLNVLKHIEGKPLKLIETLAQNIADEILTEEKVEKVIVTVHKPNAPVAVLFTDISVTVSRKQDD
ncbi:MAG: hypothetical protein RLZZ330_322 [Actinomycetota bacterium]|jgi:dihydroneopterin aldolase